MGVVSGDRTLPYRVCVHLITSMDGRNFVAFNCDSGCVLTELSEFCVGFIVNAVFTPLVKLGIVLSVLDFPIANGVL